MSLTFKTGVEEYARQCATQRRRYEDCLQKTRLSETPEDAAQNYTITEEVMQSCMIDLLEMPRDPLSCDGQTCDGQTPVLDETRTTEFKAYQWQDTCSSKPTQSVSHSTGKSSRSVSYGAP